MKKIKVLHLITRLISGGAQGTALAIANGLDRNRFDVTFACGPQDFDRAMAARWDRDLIIIPDLIREIHLLKDIKALIQLYFFLKKRKFDIINTHTSKAGFLGRVASKLAGVPIIFYTPHGSIYRPFYFGPMATYFLSRLENFAASFTDKIITCSVNEKKDLLRHNIGTEDRYVTIYWGREQPVYTFAPIAIGAQYSAQGTPGFGSTSSPHLKPSRAKSRGSPGGLHLQIPSDISIR
ncbi:MAG: glycosyltransferase, partial [Candidatus Omnitrophota bacterium]